MACGQIGNLVVDLPKRRRKARVGLLDPSSRRQLSRSAVGGGGSSARGRTASGETAPSPSRRAKLRGKLGGTGGIGDYIPQTEMDAMANLRAQARRNLAILPQATIELVQENAARDHPRVLEGSATWGPFNLIHREPDAAAVALCSAAQAPRLRASRSARGPRNDMTRRASADRWRRLVADYNPAALVRLTRNRSRRRW